MVACLESGAFCWLTAFGYRAKKLELTGFSPMNKEFQAIVLCIFAAGGAHAQLATCSPTAVLKSGVKGIYSIDSLDYIRGMNARRPEGANADALLESRLRAEHTKCVRLRLSEAEREVFRIADEYKSHQAKRAAGAWVVDNGLLIFGAMAGGGTSVATKFVTKSIATVGVASTVLNIGVGRTLIDQLIDSPGGYLNRIASMAYAQDYAESAISGKPVTAAAVLNRLDALLRSPESPLRDDEGSINAALSAAMVRLREIQSNAPSTDAEKWFQDALFSHFGFKPDTSLENMRQFGGQPLTAAQIKQAQNLVWKGREADRALTEAKVVAANLLNKATQAGDLANEALPSDAKVVLVGQEILSRMDPRTVADPTLLHNALVALQAECPAEICVAIRKQIEHAKFRMRAKEVAIAAEGVQQASLTAVKALALVGADPDIIRGLSVVAASADTIGKVSARIAGASALGPMGWVSVAGELLDLGGSLSSMFGGSSGPSPEAEMNRRVLEALANISRQIEGLRKEIRDQFSDNRRQLALLEVYARLTTELVQNKAEYSGYRQCLLFESAAHSYVTTHGSSPINALTSNWGGSKLLARDCASWLFSKYPEAFAIERNRVNPIFSTMLRDLQPGGKQLTSSERDAFLNGLNQETVGFERLVRLTRYSIAWLQGAGSSPAGLGALMYSAPNFRALEGAFVRLKNPQTGHADPSELAELLAGLGDIASRQLAPPSGSMAGTFHSMLKRQLDTERVARLLTAARLLRSFQPYIEPKSEGLIRTVEFVEPTDDASLIGKANPTWMWAASTLAYLIKVQETLYRGDFAIPLISELLNGRNEPSQCPPAPPNANGKSLCERYGRDVLSMLTEDARIVVALFPEVRANVGAWRVRLAMRMPHSQDGSLVPPFRETSSGSGFQPHYGIALDLNSYVRLSELMPSETIFQLNTNYQDREGYADFSADTETHMRWFLGLSGNCSGIHAAAQNGRVRCHNGKCEGVEISKDAFGNWSISSTLSVLPPNEPMTTADELQAWRSSLQQLCILAPLPSRQALESGRMQARISHEPVMQIADDFLVVASREVNRHGALIQLNDHSMETLSAQARDELMASIFFSLNAPPFFNDVRP